MEELTEGEWLDEPTAKPPGAFSLYNAFAANSDLPAPNDAIILEDIPAELERPENGIDCY